MRKIWRVTYRTQFSSSSGMQTYALPIKEHVGVYVVADDSLRSVEEVVRKTLDNQTRLFPIVSGECLGDCIVIH